jgi:hypothetical protein
MKIEENLYLFIKLVKPRVKTARAFILFYYGW